MGTPTPIEVSSLGMADSVILMILALVVFGPRRLPQIGRQIGKLMFEFRKASNDFKFQMEEELRMSEDAERKLKEDAARTRVLLDQAAVHAQPLQDPTVEVPEFDQSAISAPAPVTAEPVVEHLPRVSTPAPEIHPPSTGETVAADRSNAAGSNAAEPNASEPTAAAEQAQSSSTEPVSQHG